MAFKEGLKRIKNILYLLGGGSVLVALYIRIQIGSLNSSTKSLPLDPDGFFYRSKLDASGVPYGINVDLLWAVVLPILPFAIGIYIINGFLKAKDADQDEPQSE